jgi:hypothetical protein
MITESDDADLGPRVLALGEVGFGPAEMAAALGMTQAQLEARQAADAGFAEAMALAEGAAGGGAARRAGPDRAGRDAGSGVGVGRSNRRRRWAGDAKIA